MSEAYKHVFNLVAVEVSPPGLIIYATSGRADNFLHLYKRFSKNHPTKYGLSCQFFEYCGHARVYIYVH